ncbi:transposase [Vibrio crassostreae]|nr:MULTISPECIES: hypothetical protein [Vibrio]MCC4782889.1 hypothetical protein [Vibrio lentus]MCC4857007.1 hypothetical protein [Vibrio lentus]ROO57789.1 hypothetical protein EDB56_101936 [Vibrio crassostreae]ROQ87996.1 hypothetical protein EDB72_1550 [Vibrio crassostreae]ROS70804.1 hypothetical protein EDB73_101482 [Vibrio crassostreae]
MNGKLRTALSLKLKKQDISSQPPRLVRSNAAFEPNPAPSEHHKKESR